MDERAQPEMTIMQANLRHELEERAQKVAREERNRAAIAEGERLRAAEERRKLNNDPTVAAALVRIDAQQKAEKRRRAEEEQRRFAEARAELEKELERRLTLWMSHGGDPDAFPRADIQREILMEKQQARLRLQQQGSVF